MKVIISVFLSIILACVPCFAYTADSFVIDTDPYVFKKVQSASLMSASPVMTLSEVAAAAETGGVTSVSGYDFLDRFSSSDIPAVVYRVYHEEDYIGLPGYDPIIIPEFYEQRPYPFTTSEVSRWVSRSNQTYYMKGPTVTSPSELNNGEVDGVFSGLFYNNDSTIASINACELDFDVSSFGEFTSFELSGRARASSYIWNYNTNSLAAVSRNGSIYLYVNGLNVHTFDLVYDGTNNIDFAHFTYNSTEPITSVSFRFNFTPTLLESVPSLVDSQFAFKFDESLKFSVIQEDQLLNGFNDQAQDNINSHSQLESEWTGSMSQNFAELDLDSFSFPVGAASAFSLISGIFTDLWNSMGDFKIAYVFPLYLGIVLLLVGRISKFSGGRSSSGKGKGDDSA